MLRLMCGVSGSGKSSHARIMKAKYGSTIIEPDAFRLQMTGQAWYAPAEQWIWATVKTVINVLLKSDQDVILDATNISKHSRGEWIKLAKELNSPIIACAHVIPKAICIERNAWRERSVPDAVLKSQMDRYILPSIHDGFDSVLFYGTKEGSFEYHLQGYANSDGEVGGDYRKLEYVMPYIETMEK